MTRRAVAALVLLAAVAPARAEEPQRLEPVVVTATRSEQRLDDAPASVTVLIRDDIGQGAGQGLVVVDLSVSRRIARWGEIFVAVENPLDSTYTTGRTGDGVVSIGAPFLVHDGVRLQYR